MQLNKNLASKSPIRQQFKYMVDLQLAALRSPSPLTQNTSSVFTSQALPLELESTSSTTMPQFTHHIFQLSCWAVILHQTYQVRRDAKNLRQDSKDLLQDAKDLQSDVQNMARKSKQGAHRIEKPRNQSAKCEDPGMWLQKWEEYMAVRGGAGGIYVLHGICYHVPRSR
jgi:uncharacterized protein YlxW (UPF0749 family)